MILEENYELSNGVLIPKLALGTWQTRSGKQAKNSVLAALSCGYRHIDTAYAYGNEKSVGAAIAESGLKREDVFVTTKLPSHIKSFDGALKYCEKSLKNLGLDYVDLYLIHAPWPWSRVGKDCTAGNIEAWKGFIKLYEEKKARAIGVSNFGINDIEAIVSATGVKPMANQIRYFIGNTQEPLTQYCNKNGILIEAYSPFATGRIVEHPKLAALSEKYGKSIPKICLRYCLQKGTLPLPKSTHADRIKDNTDVDFILTDEDMAYLDSLKHIAPPQKLRY